jgi:hypothetical protein
MGFLGAAILLYFLSFLQSKCGNCLIIRISLTFIDFDFFRANVSQNICALSLMADHAFLRRSKSRKMSPVHTVSDTAIDALCLELLEEAKTESGTWLLATHNRLIEMISHISAESFERFFVQIIKALILPTASGRERFKLAQICTLCRGKQCPRVNDLLLFYRKEILEATNPMGDPLDEPIAKLLASLYQQQAKATTSPPIMVVRCRVQRPVSLRWFNFSKTPEP